MADEKKNRYELADIATQTETVIYDNIEKKQYTTQEALLKIINDLDELKIRLG